MVSGGSVVGGNVVVGASVVVGAIVVVVGGVVVVVVAAVVDVDDVVLVDDVVVVSRVVVGVSSVSPSSSSWLTRNMARPTTMMSVSRTMMAIISPLVVEDGLSSSYCGSSSYSAY